MSRLDTALARRDDPAPSPDTAGALGRRLAETLSRRRTLTPSEPRGRLGRGRRREAAVRALEPVGARLVRSLERQIIRVVERRLDAGGAGPAPGALEQRLVAALQRRLPDGRPAGTPAAAWGSLDIRRHAARSLQRRRPSRLPSRQQTTLRSLVVSIFARRIAGALALFLRVLGRSVVSRPVRRLVGLVAVRAIRARASRQAGLLALLLGAIALLTRRLRTWLPGEPGEARAATVLVVRLLIALQRITARLLRPGAGG